MNFKELEHANAVGRNDQANFLEQELNKSKVSDFLLCSKLHGYKPVDPMLKSAKEALLNIIILKGFYLLLIS